MRRGFKAAGSPDPMRESRMARRAIKTVLWMKRAVRRGFRLVRVMGAQYPKHDEIRVEARQTKQDDKETRL